MNGYVVALQAAQKAGIIPLTSQCNVACVFCSHRGNPVGLRVHKMKPLSLTQVKDLLSIMPVHKVITIGESATTVVEGEPFTHPDIEKVLTMIRHQMPTSMIRITTNGTLLDKKRVDLLASLQPLELQVSLNSITPTWRQKLHQGEVEGHMPHMFEHLQAKDLPFSVSIVTVPHITGWEELEKTLNFADGVGPQVIRLFLPSYTRHVAPDQQVPSWLWSQVRQRILRWRQHYRTPLLLEPAVIDDLSATVVGVQTESPAAAIGLRMGDVIMAVNEQVPFSRVHAFEMINQYQHPVVKVLRGKQPLELKLSKAAGEKSGVVMDYDLSLKDWEKLKGLVMAHKEQGLYICTSILAFPRISKALSQLGSVDGVSIVPVPSSYWGGNIISAGLLTVSDYALALKHHSIDSVIALPAVSFNEKGQDLTGTHYGALNQFGRIVIG